MEFYNSLPPQQIPFSKKNKTWRKQHLDWAENHTIGYPSVRNTLRHKKINYDLVNGVIHMDDMMHLINPENFVDGTIPKQIQHYPIMNSKLELLRGEELKRVFDFRAIITNPEGISEVEENKKQELISRLTSIIEDDSANDEEVQKRLNEMQEFFTYKWQDMKEVRDNFILKHYTKEYDMPTMFNEGFMDAMIVAEEIYQCDIVGGEPVVYKLNPMNVRVFRSSYSNRIEDADVIILEDYWSPGKIQDVYGEVLTPKDLLYIESGTKGNDGYTYDEREGFIDSKYLSLNTVYSEGGELFYFDPLNADVHYKGVPFDAEGNVRVLRMFWKSKRKIKKVKSYDPVTGESIYNFYPEDYILKKELGEEETVFYINEAWEGTKIGEEIYVNMGPRNIQYNRMGNPSRCHFGIVGTIYNLNESRPYSMVDIMKPFNYMYDVIHDRLNRLVAKNWGKLIQFDFAKKPKDWTIDKWLYYAKKSSIMVVDSFNEGNVGAATGILAGSLNNASSGVVDAELANSIQMHINLLSFIKEELSETIGISRQREGAISNRETVGGVERSTLQSSYITEWLFALHDNLKKRVLECFAETAKIAFKGRNKKFMYILSDGARQIVNVDGDEYAETDAGIVIDNGEGTQRLNQQLDSIAQFALQSQAYSLSSIMRLYTTASLAEKQRMIENEEKAIQERNSQAQQQQQQMQQQALEQQARAEQLKMEQENMLNERDNATKIEVARINANVQTNNTEVEDNSRQQSFKETIRQFDEKIALERENLALKRKQLNANINRIK